MENDRVSKSFSKSKSDKIQEARAFLLQFAEKTNVLTDEDLRERIADVEQDIMTYGTYKHTIEELHFGCCLAWSISGQCTMKMEASSLEFKDCRHIISAEDCFDCIVEHLFRANNGGTINPVISVFPPKADGESAPIRIWNKQLFGYAAYKRKDGSIMGDPINLEFTSFCVDLGWEPPCEQSDFDVLPIVISDRDLGHDSPRIFQLPREAILEVHIEHPDHDLFSMLNMRWYGIPAISDMGVDIGGVYYQTCPFSGLYSITDIARNLLDHQRFNLATAVAAACNISRTNIDEWRENVLLQVHKAIHHSFAKASVSIVDQDTEIEAFMDSYTDEIKLLNSIGTPQCRTNACIFEEQNINRKEPLTVTTAGKIGNGHLYSCKGEVDQNGHQKSCNFPEDEVLSIKYQGFARVIRSDTKSELRNAMKEQSSNSLSRYAHKLGRSTDLFYFQVPEDRRDLVEILRPGDHVALYPKNLEDVLDLTIDRISIDQVESVVSLRDAIRSHIDLVKPVSCNALEELQSVTDDSARIVLDELVSSESYPSVEALVTQLPPRTVPFEWVLHCAPLMKPRLYSIASISKEDRTISICQSAYSFEQNGQSGTTSRWLRSLQGGDDAEAIFSRTNFHLPKDETAPVLLIANETGIASSRPFWSSRSHSPMHLFFECRNQEELPFASEINALARDKKIDPFIAYSHDPNNAMNVGSLLKQEAGTVLSLLHNPKAHVYFRGTPVVEQVVRNKLLMILCSGNDEYPGIEMSHAVEKLVIMKMQKRLVTEVYGAAKLQGFYTMELQWKNTMLHVVKALSHLEKINLPRPRPEVMFQNTKLVSKHSWFTEFRPEHSSSRSKRMQRSRTSMARRNSRSTILKDYTHELNRFTNMSADDIDLANRRHWSDTSVVSKDDISTNSVPEECTSELNNKSINVNEDDSTTISVNISTTSVHEEHATRLADMDDRHKPLHLNNKPPSESMAERKRKPFWKAFRTSPNKKKSNNAKSTTSWKSKLSIHKKCFTRNAVDETAHTHIEMSLRDWNTEGNMNENNTEKVQNRKRMACRSVAA